MKRAVYRSQNRLVDSIELVVSDENKNEHEDLTPRERDRWAMLATYSYKVIMLGSMEVRRTLIDIIFMHFQKTR
jgi:hypothetical protein